MHDSYHNGEGMINKIAKKIWITPWLFIIRLSFECDNDHRESGGDDDNGDDGDGCGNYDGDNVSSILLAMSVLSINF
jgi:hypothetical protein